MQSGRRVYAYNIFINIFMWLLSQRRCAGFNIQLATVCDQIEAIMSEK